MSQKYNFSKTISLEQDIDPSEALCASATPAEADMLRILALYQIFGDDVPQTYLKRRLRYSNPWEYYDSLFYEEFTDSQLCYEFARAIIELQENNIFALNTADMKKSCPYHIGLNSLPVLFRRDGHIFDLKNGRLTGIIPYAANIKLHYQELISFETLSQQLYDLNSGDMRHKRGTLLNHTTEIKYIKTHPHFPALSGQRGVFAKNNISKGTVIGYYSGDMASLGDNMPPLLCSWPLATYKHKITFMLTRRFIRTYLEWTDGYILGNSMKLVNTACPQFDGRQPLSLKNAPAYGNIACYFGHFETEDIIKYMTIPFYITMRDITEGEELMTFYPLR